MRSRGVHLVAALVLLLAAGLSSATAAGDAEGNLEVASVWPDGRLAWASGHYDLSEQGRFLIFARPERHRQRV